MPTWPGTLPTIPLQDNYREGQQPGAAIRTPTETGPPKQRNRFRAQVLTYTVTWDMTSSQLDTFWIFYRTTLGNGALSFDGLPAPRTGATVTHRFSVDQPPEASPTGYDNYNVTVRLEILP